MRNSNFHPTWKQKNNRKDKYAYSLKWFKTYKLKGWTHSFKSKAIIRPGPWQCVLPSAKFIACMLHCSYSTYFFLASELSIEWAHSLYWQIIFSRSWNGQILFVKKYSDSTKRFSETDIINMLELLIESIFVIFVGRVFQQTFGISMCTQYAPLLADVFRYSYEVDFIQGLLNKDEKKLARSIFSRSVI